jgi:hypothetical protein
MVESRLRNKVNEYADIIEGIEKFEISEEELKHIGDKIEISHEENLGDVLRYIKTFLG